MCPTYVSFALLIDPQLICAEVLHSFPRSEKVQQQSGNEVCQKRLVKKKKKKKKKKKFLDMSIRPEIHEKNPHLGENYLLLLQVTVFTQARPDHPDTNPLLGSHCFCRKQRRLQPLPIRHCHHWCPSLRHLWSVSSAQIYLQAENKIADSACSPRMLRGTINECTGQ